MVQRLETKKETPYLLLRKNIDLRRIFPFEQPRSFPNHRLAQLFPSFARMAVRRSGVVHASVLHRASFFLNQDPFEVLDICVEPCFRLDAMLDEPTEVRHPSKDILNRKERTFSMARSAS